MTLADLSLGNAFGMAPDGFGQTEATLGSGQWSPGEHWSTALAKHVAKSPERRAWERARHHVGMLDPDIAAMRSIALQAKIRMQRDRDYDRQEKRQRDWLEHAVMGWFD